MTLAVLLAGYLVICDLYLTSSSIDPSTKPKCFSVLLRGAKGGIPNNTRCYDLRCRKTEVRELCNFYA